jgi:hypothetical protein
MRYRADGFKAEGRRQRAEVKCTPLNRETLYICTIAIEPERCGFAQNANLYLQGLLKHPQAVYYLPGQVTG